MGNLKSSAKSRELPDVRLGQITTAQLIIQVSRSLGVHNSLRTATCTQQNLLAYHAGILTCHSVYSNLHLFKMSKDIRKSLITTQAEGAFLRESENAKHGI